MLLGETLYIYTLHAMIFISRFRALHVSERMLVGLY